MAQTGNNNDNFRSSVKKCYGKLNRIHVFFALFTAALFVESFGATYIISTTQAIERQFQIPSKLSGLMVSASDFAYIPSVIFVSYFGSRGNRAKWIGVGALITAASHLLISSSNFVFPVEQSTFNYTAIQNRLLPSKALLARSAKFAELFDYEPIKDRINEKLREDFLRKVTSDNLSIKMTEQRIQDYVRSDNQNWTTSDRYTLDGNLLSKIVQKMRAVIDGDTNGSVTEVRNLLQQYVHERVNEAKQDMTNIRNSARAPFAFCSKLINDVREMIKETKCGRESFHEGPFIMLFLGLIGFGIGRTMPWSLGIPMIDDNFSKKELPALFAGLNFIRILGPVCGFLIGSFCSSFYYTLKPPPGLTAKDPTWIGAWWMGYLFIGLLLIAPSTALYLFAIKSKSTKTLQSLSVPIKDSDCLQKKKKTLSVFDKHQDNDNELSIREKFRAFRKAYAEILRSKAYVGILVARLLDLLAFRGYMVFLPKYLENQFGIPQYNVHILMAVFGVTGFAMGTVSGGLILRRFKFNGRCAAIFILILSLFNSAIFLGKAFIGCYSTVNAVGASGRSNNYNYTLPCNANCNCQSASLYPICDKSGYVFFSPCHAGCHDVKVIDEKKYELEFSSCECSPGEVLSKGNCMDNCKLKALLFFFLTLIGSFVAGHCLVPGMLLLLRTVQPAHRSIALGLQGFLVSLFASLPSPLIWGAIVDTTCLVWSHTCPLTKGACAVYEPVLLRQRLHFTYVGLRLISAIADIYVVKNVGNLNIVGEEADDINKRNSIMMNHVHSGHNDN